MSGQRVRARVWRNGRRETHELQLGPDSPITRSSVYMALCRKFKTTRWTLLSWWVVSKQRGDKS